MENLRHLPTVLLIFILLNCPPSLSLFLFSVAFLFILICTLAFSVEKQKQKIIKKKKARVKIKSQASAFLFFYSPPLAQLFLFFQPLVFSVGLNNRKKRVPLPLLENNNRNISKNKRRKMKRSSFKFSWPRQLIQFKRLKLTTHDGKMKVRFLLSVFLLILPHR